MIKELLLRTIDDVKNRFQYFPLKWGTCDRRGFSPIQKYTAKIRQQAFCMRAD